MEIDSPRITIRKGRSAESSNEETEAKKRRNEEQSSPSHGQEVQVEGCPEKSHHLSPSPTPCTSSSAADVISQSQAVAVAENFKFSADNRNISIRAKGQISGEIVGLKQEINNCYENNVINHLHGSDNFKSMLERTRASMDASCPQGFVETSGYRLARDLLQEQSRCVVTGQAGSGKTTLAYRLLTHFSSHGFQCVELLSPDEYKEVPWRQNQADFKLLVFIDDVVGRSNLEVALKKKWEKKLEKMMPFVSTGHVKLILASREHIFAAFRGGSEREVLSATPEVALACDKLVLPFLERKQILINAMTFKKVGFPGKLTENEVVKAAVDSQQIGYPQLCWFFVTNAEARVDPINFFSSPVEFLKKEFSSLKLDDRRSFYVLLLVLLREGKLSQAFLRSEKSRKFLSEVADVVGLSRVPKFGEIKSTATEMCRSYLRYDREARTYLFAHQSVWDTLFVFLCEEDFEKAMKICSCKQVVLYVSTEGSRDSGRGFTYKAPRGEWSVLARKLLQELASGATELACSHPCLQDPSFVQIFLYEILKEEDVRALLSPKAEALTLREQSYKISASDYSNCSLKCGEFLNSATSAGCKGQTTMKTLLQYSHPVSFLAIHKCFTMVQHILDSDFFSKLAADAKSQILTEVLGCACFVAKASFVGDLLQCGAVPSAECVLAACSAEEEDVELVERLLQWRPLLTTEQQCELARVAVLKDRPRTLRLVLSGLSVPDDDRALLDSILAELVLFTHGANLISINQSLELSNFSSLFLYLTKAGAQLHHSVSLCLAAGHWEPSVLQKLSDSLAVVTEKDVAPASSTPDGTAAAKTSDGSITRTSKDVSVVHAEKKDTAAHTSDKSTTGKAEDIPAYSSVKKHTAVLSAKDDADNTPLHWAARFGVLSNVQFLLELSDQGGQPATLVNAQNKKGYSALHFAAEQGHLNVVVALLTAKADTGLLNKRHDSALHLATQKGHSAVVEALVQSGANVNSANDKKNTALHVAAKSGQLNILDTLLENGANADLVNQQGHTALHILTSISRLDFGDSKISEEVVVGDYKENTRSDKKIVLNLIAATSKQTSKTDPPLHLATRQGKLSMVKMLLDDGADIDAKNSKGATALHEAAGHCHLHVADLLLQRGAKTSQPDEAGNTVLHALAKSHLQTKVDSGAVEHFQVAKLVKKWDVFVNAVNNTGDTPIMTALSKGNLFLVTEMLRRNPDLSLKNNAKDSVLHALAGTAYLASGTHEDRSPQQTVAVLVGEFKSCLDEVNEAGDTPLLTALHAGNFCVVKELLTYHCNLNVTNKKGWTALHALASGPLIRGDRETQHVIHLVMDKCSEFVNSQDEAGDSPILIAAGKGNIALVKCLQTHDADLSVLNENRDSILHALASAGDLTGGLGTTSSTRDFVANLTGDISEEFIDLPNGAGNTPVMLASRSGNSLLVQELLRRECDLSRVNSDGETVLHLLAQVAHLPAGRTLGEWREASSLVAALASEIGVLATATDNKGVSARAIASRLAEVHGERYSGSHLTSLWSKEVTPSETVHVLCLEAQDCDSEFQDDSDDSESSHYGSDECNDMYDGADGAVGCFEVDDQDYGDPDDDDSDDSESSHYGSDECNDMYDGADGADGCFDVDDQDYGDPDDDDSDDSESSHYGNDEYNYMYDGDDGCFDVDDQDYGDPDDSSDQDNEDDFHYFEDDGREDEYLDQNYYNVVDDSDNSDED